MYAVTVTFTLFPGEMERFLPLMLENARASLAGEPGCQLFDVCTDPAHADTVFLYEIYDHRDAFDAHRETQHFRDFDAESGAMVMEKTVMTFSEVRR